MTYSRLVCCLLSVLVWHPWVSEAAESWLTVKVTVTSPPPCIINNNQQIVVEFNEVMTTQVYVNNYRRPVNYTLSCTGLSSNALKLQIVGTAGFNSQVLKTDKAGLGIALLQGENRVAVNGFLNFTYPNAPKLEAALVKQSGATLVGGRFNASATLKVIYQ